MDEQTQGLPEPVKIGCDAAELDRQRTKARRYSMLLIALWITAFVIGTIVFIAAGVVVALIYLIVALAGMGFATISITRIKNKYSTSFKITIVRAELEKALQKLEYNPNERFNDHTLFACGLFPDFNRSEGNDYFAGDCKGRRYTYSDLHLEEKEEYQTTDSDGNTHTDTRWVTVFRGRLIMFDHDAMIDDSVCVCDKRMRNFKSDLQTEHIAFNQRYLIKADDPVAAFRVLTPHMMETIMTVADRIAAPASVSFLQGKAFVAIVDEDAFEADITGNIALAETHERIKSEVAALVNIFETLNMITDSRG